MFILKLKTENAAFSEQPLEEIARILRDAAEELESGRYNRSLQDVNGNTVGSFSYKE